MSSPKRAAPVIAPRRSRSGPAFVAAGPSSRLSAVQAACARLFAGSAVLRQKVKNAGDIADYVGWQLDRFGTTHTYTKREDLWADLVGRLDRSQPLTVLEFGVAWGYTTAWWLDRIDNPALIWHGFDRFTGLPRAWRGMPEGAFDAAGRPPQVSDERVHWHIGDVEQTLAELPEKDLTGPRRVVLFDLDIYEPTAAAWRHVAPWLRAGDLLYFDEAMDDDERRVLDELVLPTGAVEYLGATASALTLLVTRDIGAAA